MPENWDAVIGGGRDSATVKTPKRREKSGGWHMSRHNIRYILIQAEILGQYYCGQGEELE